MLRVFISAGQMNDVHDKINQRGEVRDREQSHCESADLEEVNGEGEKGSARILLRRPDDRCVSVNKGCAASQSLSACPRAKLVCRSDKKNQKKNNKQDIKEDSTTPRGERLQRASARCSTEAPPSLKYWNEVGYFQPSSHTPAPTAAPKGPSRVI